MPVAALRVRTGVAMRVLVDRVRVKVSMSAVLAWRMHVQPTRGPNGADAQHDQHEAHDELCPFIGSIGDVDIAEREQPTDN
jgi:hypothetical protein